MGLGKIQKKLKLSVSREASKQEQKQIKTNKTKQNKRRFRATACLADIWGQFYSSVGSNSKGIEAQSEMK